MPYDAFGERYGILRPTHATASAQAGGAPDSRAGPLEILRLMGLSERTHYAVRELPCSSRRL
eukprot:925880-Prymnesium_polylepis.1